MYREYFTLPLSLESIVHQKEHSRCGLHQSLEQHLHLILTTAFSEFSMDEEFGCAIWEHEFDNLTSGSKLKELIKQSLLSAIAAHEKRLINLRIELLVRHEELLDMERTRRVKKRIEISVSGKINITNEKFDYRDCFFIGPLSY